MLRAHRFICAAIATLVLAPLTGCSFDSPLTDLQCDNEGEIDGNRVCQDGIWVERASGDTSGQDTGGEDADAGDITPPEDTGDVQPPEDVRDTETEDTRDTSTQDTRDTATEDTRDTSTEDTQDTAEDTSTQDTTDTADTADTTDTADTVDTADTADTTDIGGPCVTPETVTNNPALGYWSLDAPNANGAYPHEGTAAFGPATPSSDSAADPLNITGVSGNAVEMDGDMDYLKIDHHPDMLISRGTVVFWMKVDSFVGTQGLWSKDASGNPDGGHLTLDVRDDQRVHVRLQSDRMSYSIQSGVLQPDQWIHVALLFGPTNVGEGLQLYIDGTQVASDPYVGGLSSNIQGEKASNDEPIGLGVTTITWASGNTSSWPSSNEELSGALDEVALFDQRLTPQEIQKLAQNACP